MAQAASSLRPDVYHKVTETIIAQIEAGVGTYRMPWHHSGAPLSRPRNAVALTFYRGINVLTLWAAAHAAGYPSGLWATYRQWKQAGGQVRQGERGHLVVFWKQLGPSADADEGDDGETVAEPVAA